MRPSLYVFAGSATLLMILTSFATAQEQASRSSDTLDAIQDQLEEQRQIILKQQEAIETLRQDEASGQAKQSGLTWSGYGVINYFNRDLETNPDARDAVDVERFILAPSYRFTDRIYLDAEIEFEHGGTGSTLELDTQEEFGEFEQEIEAGGEIILEQLNLVISQNRALNWRLGHMILPFGLANPGHEPTRYFTVMRPESETALLPVVWHETGVGLFGRWRDFEYVVQIVNGLDSTGFSSRNFIAPGHQGRFEQVNAEAFAYLGRLDYQPLLGVTVGATVYYGNTVPNRPKPDLEDVDAPLTLVEGHLVVERGPWTLRALYIHGNLDNADQITDANRTLSNNLGVKGNPVGSTADALGIEAGFDVLSLIETGHRLDIFARYDDYDTMKDTDGDVFDNPRWERTAWTVGANYRPLTQLVFKGQFTTRDLESGETDRIAAGGLGFEF